MAVRIEQIANLTAGTLTARGFMTAGVMGIPEDDESRLTDVKDRISHGGGGGGGGGEGEVVVVVAAAAEAPTLRMIAVPSWT